MDVSKPRNNRYVILLTLASCLILVVGWRARPGELSQSAPTLPSENELAQLGRRAERRSLESSTSYFASVAGQVDASVVHVPRAGASGVVWDASLIVTAPLQADAVVPAVASMANPVAARVVVGGPHLPLAVIKSAEGQPGSSPAQPAPSPGEPGDWLVAVWRTERERAFAATTFLQSAPVRCGAVQLEEVVSSLSFTPAMAGGGLFDLDGRLLGVILPCGPRFAAISVAGVQALLDRAQTVAQRLLSLYGLALGPLTEQEKLHFKSPDGVLVREIWKGTVADQVELMPGDIIRSVGRLPVETMQDVHPLAAPSPGQAVQLTVVRGGKTLLVALPAAVTPGEPPSAAAGAGLVLASTPESYRIEAVLPGSRADLSGVEPGDRLVRIGHAPPRSLNQVRRVFTDPRSLPVFIEVDRGPRRVGILVR